jgi:hypothetical protein
MLGLRSCTVESVPVRSSEHRCRIGRACQKSDRGLAMHGGTKDEADVACEQVAVYT